MKRILSLILFFATCLTFFVGCANTDDTMNIASSLDRNLNKLSSIATELDTIDTNYIANPDIISSQKISLPNNNETKTYALAFNHYDTETNDLIKNLIIQELQEKYLNNNGNCSYCGETYCCDENGYCTSCQNSILCDENGNCTNCNSPLSLNDDFNCTNCNSYSLIKKDNNSGYSVDLLSVQENTSNTINENTETSLPLSDNLGETNEEFVEDNLNNSDTIESETETTIIPLAEEPVLNNIVEEDAVSDTTPLEDTIIPNDETSAVNNSETSNETTLADNNNSNIKFYYYTRESFDPITLKYRPRYISEYNESNINEQLVSYLYKVQKLYAMTEDAIEANNILNECKFTLIESVKEVKDLNKNIINGNCEPSLTQLQALKNYTQDIKNTIKNLKSCNGDLTDEVNNISNNANTSVATSVDVLNSNYLKLINHIDTRITYHESAIATLEQLKYLLNEAVGNDSITSEEIDEIINELVDNTPITDDSNSLIEENGLNNEIEVLLPENDIENDTELNETNTENNNETSENVVSENEEDDINEDEDLTASSDNEGSMSNIDTYMDKTFDSNNIDVAEDNNNIEENNEENNTMHNNIQNTEKLENTENVENNESTDNNTLDNFQNGSATGYANNNVNSTGNGYQTSTGFNNSIITQNNLNNDDGYGGYYYGSDGKIRNNGVNNDNEIGNNGNTVQNSMNNDNNVNTYGYNTIIDMLNQGTVNNGINTLETKPNYVNSNIETI